METSQVGEGPVNGGIDVFVSRVGCAAADRPKQKVKITQPIGAGFQLVRGISADTQLVAFKGDLEEHGFVEVEGASKIHGECDLTATQRADESSVGRHGRLL